MSHIESSHNDSELTVSLLGRIDSSNAQSVENEILNAQNSGAFNKIIIDCDRLEYISSAGLRVILRVKKSCPDTTIINASSEIYEIFDMTGFTEMMTVVKAYRRISVDDCEVIGQGANGKVYRIDPDTIVKVYLNPDSLPDIKRERELARKAFVLGIPTAIPYDVVRVGEGYGSVFELLNATSFAKILKNEPRRFDEIAALSVDLLKKIHSTEVKKGDMPDMKAVALDWARFVADYLSPELSNKLISLIDAVPETNRMMHGDYHVKNVMLQNGESLLIDMDTLCTGHPIFEFASIYNAYLGFADLDHGIDLSFIGLPYETCERFFGETMRLYFDTYSQEQIQNIKKKAMIVGYTRIMRRTIRRQGFDTPEGKAVIENCKKHLEDLLPTVDSLTF